MYAASGIERRVGVVLLADLGEELEAGAPVTVAVLHADLGEHPGHRFGSDPTIDRRHRPEATRGREGVRVRLPAAAGQQPRTGKLLDAEGQAHIGFSRLDRQAGDPQGGGAGGAGVGHVEDGDSGLTDLLLQLLTDAGIGRHQVAGSDHPDVLHLDAAVGQGTQNRFSGQVDQVLVRMLAEFRHVDAQDPQVI